jgi:hypothetical protein
MTATKEIDLMKALTTSLRHLERCRTCNDALPVPPAPRVCARCGTVKVTPLHQEWPQSLKTFLLLQYAARHIFADFRPMQRSWELLLTGNYEGRWVGGRLHKSGCDPDEVFALAVKEAEEWRLAGAVTDFL